MARMYAVAVSKSQNRRIVYERRNENEIEHLRQSICRNSNWEIVECGIINNNHSRQSSECF